MRPDNVIELHSVTVQILLWTDWPVGCIEAYRSQCLLENFFSLFPWRHRCSINYCGSWTRFYM